MRKYNYNVVGNKVICVSKFAGQTVKGVAKCDESEDKFDLKVGKRLAKLRCDFKIVQKSLKNAVKHHDKVLEETGRQVTRFNRAKHRLDTSLDMFHAVKQELDELTKELS